MMGKILPETCWADLIDQKIIVASSWYICITLPKMLSVAKNSWKRQMPWKFEHKAASNTRLHPTSDWGIQEQTSEDLDKINKTIIQYMKLH